MGTPTTSLINNTDWLKGYDLYKQGYPLPWDNESLRAGWIAARDEAKEAQP